MTEYYTKKVHHCITLQISAKALNISKWNPLLS